MQFTVFKSNKREVSSDLSPQTRPRQQPGFVETHLLLELSSCIHFRPLRCRRVTINSHHEVLPVMDPQEAYLQLRGSLTAPVLSIDQWVYKDGIGALDTASSATSQTSPRSRKGSRYIKNGCLLC